MFFLALYQLILTISSMVCKLFKSLLAPFNATFVWEVFRCLFAFHTPPFKEVCWVSSVHEENKPTISREIQSQKIGFFNPIE